MRCGHRGAFIPLSRFSAPSAPLPAACQVLRYEPGQYYKAQCAQATAHQPRPRRAAPRAVRSAAPPFPPTRCPRCSHDWVDAHVQFPFGPRVYTFFLYLSDVAEGGGTHFPELNLTVQPKLGRALWWPSVLEARPDAQDGRTAHEAQPVVSGVKKAANVWIHLYDFMTPYAKGCAP